MSDWVEVTITARYPLPGDPAERQARYGTTETALCILADTRLDPADLIGRCEGVYTSLVLAEGDLSDVCRCSIKRRFHVGAGATIKATPWSDETCDGFVLAAGGVGES